jgi:DNA uptake protein ComE-like DNA-binding protein
MVKRMTSKERILQMAEEAAAGKEKKTEKKKKATTRKKKVETIQRHKAVWKIFDASYKEVACFPYSEKNEAYAKADDLTKKKNNKYFVNEIKVLMKDE